MCLWPLPLNLFADSIQRHVCCNHRYLLRVEALHCLPDEIHDLKDHRSWPCFLCEKWQQSHTADRSFHVLLAGMKCSPWYVFFCAQTFFGPQNLNTWQPFVFPCPWSQNGIRLCLHITKSFWCITLSDLCVFRMHWGDIITACFRDNQGYSFSNSWTFWCRKLHKRYGSAMKRVLGSQWWCVVVNIVNSPNSNKVFLQLWRAYTLLFLKSWRHWVAKLSDNFHCPAVRDAQPPFRQFINQICLCSKIYHQAYIDSQLCFTSSYVVLFGRGCIVSNIFLFCVEHH